MRARAKRIKALFATIETDWLPYLVLAGIVHAETRFVGPYWVGWLIVKTKGRDFPLIIKRLFGFVAMKAGAHYETKNLETPRPIKADEWPHKWQGELERVIR